ncbi:dTDP-4-dehydrorhamnose reductase [Aggregatimonas sangjinii]|uniref:dTDP-4-dehydrorhamnose reductase n=1 Tax=Aggregatimonas sangjinii TaxID=2583587 RepID=A0A5B7SYK2_9FLAO|nr:dTDP-4-dehydrorhamnose reductase [Aggregatimonas sangjinii]QCX01864.1 dTDP-4-dehydrorhamnose reductase [Aggregatimonas sangjinii]
MSKIIVTGGRGQLATCIKDESRQSENIFIFLGKEDLDITDQKAVQKVFDELRPDFCVNCAAYTAVDKAESEPVQAKRINVDGAKHLAQSCYRHGTTLIHISTDFVFDGTKNTPYNEQDVTNPLGVYGQTKLEGEKAIADNLEAHVILRTSWLYAQHGQNFMKTMLRLGKEKGILQIVDDQYGTPTYARDLARFIVRLINENTDKYGSYHYSNKGVATWYEFASAIFEYSQTQVAVMAIKSNEYPTAAQRPRYSVLAKRKVQDAFGIEIPEWKDSLKECLSKLGITQNK